MDRNVKRKVAAGAVALVAVAGGGAAIAATQLSPQQENQAVLNDAAGQLGVSPGELSAAIKSALEKRIDAAVGAGRVTAAQGEEMKQRIESGAVPLFGPGPGFGPGLGVFEHHEMFGGLDAAAAYLGLSEDELHSQLENGASLADIAESKSKTVEGLVAAMVTEAKKHLDQAVSEGDLTQAQATEMLSHLEQGIGAMVDGAPMRGMPGPVFGFRHDFQNGSSDGPPSFDGAAA